MGNIYYFGYSKPSTGGDYINIQHVIALEKLGFPVKMVYDCGYPASDALPRNSQCIQDTQFRENDYFVIGENDIQVIQFACSLKSKIILHNQNNYYFFSTIISLLGLETGPLNSSMCLSDVSAKVLIDAGYKGEVSVVKPFLPSYFQPRKKRLSIAFAPRKLPLLCKSVIAAFRSMYPEYSAVEWTLIENVDRESVAKILSESAIYASFSNLESFNLSTLEAMKCGCIVVGDHGGGGSEYKNEYANESNGLWVRADDIISYSKKIAEAIKLFKEHGEANYLSKNAITTAEGFSEEKFNQSLENFWSTKVTKLKHR